MSPILNFVTSLCHYPVAKTLGSTSTRHRSDAKVSDRCLIDVEPRVFIVWEIAHICVISKQYQRLCLLQNFSYTHVPHRHDTGNMHENIFCVTGPLCGEFTGHLWIPRTKASDAELWCFDLRLNKWLSQQSWGWWFETRSRSLWRHCNGKWKPWPYQTIVSHTIRHNRTLNVLILHSLDKWPPFRR